MSVFDFFAVLMLSAIGGYAGFDIGFRVMAYRVREIVREEVATTPERGG